MVCKIAFGFILISISLHLFAQNSDPFPILFYNVENLFDPANDPDKEDEEFTPGGDRRWTYARKSDKLTKISRVILTAGGWTPPAVVGLCEVENLNVLEELVFDTGLNHLNYQVVHYPSPDLRGIDVALLYRSNRFKVLNSRPVPVSLGGGERPTRDILYVCGIADGRDTLHLMVNHWPSRYGGEGVTRPKRMKASLVLQALRDSIFKTAPAAKVVMMGDFNDGPADDSMQALVSGVRGENPLVNLAENSTGEVPGTIRYRGEWSVFDQMVVSQTLLTDSAGLHVNPPVMQIVAPEFLLEAETGFPGERPRRTYRGFSYHGGYSDHLPVMIRLR